MIERDRSRSIKRAGSAKVKECKEPAVVKRDGLRETEKRVREWEGERERARAMGTHWGGCPLLYPRAGNDGNDVEGFEMLR